LRKSELSFKLGDFFETHNPHWWFFLEYHGEGGSEQVRFRPLFNKELLDMPVEQFLASLRFEQRGKLDQLGIEIGCFD
jgi:hypothetical protein